MATIDDNVVAQLRALDASGATAVVLTHSLGTALDLASPSRVVVFGYLATAFDLPVADVMVALGPWQGFDREGHLDDDAFDDAFARLRGAEGVA